ncbi:ZN182-like protein [Mya arenaria]|uniref:ZN182-like protein n=1 Tax=Mya arenaria TaxID=6604 RepID=A0ABY7FDW8_MYAAR|nr:ZN182-like protein [Mya arenaria]
MKSPLAESLMQQASESLVLSSPKKEKLGGLYVMCTLCDKPMQSPSHLVRHMRIHTGEKPFKCEYCDYSSSRKDHLRRHYLNTSKCMKLMREVPPEKPFECEICGYKSSRKDYIRIHQNTKKCKKMRETFMNFLSLDWLLEGSPEDLSQNQPVNAKKSLTEKVGERYYVCEVCNKLQPSPSHLQRHMRTHTGEKPYSCDMCASRFTRKDNLEYHKLKNCGKRASLL